MKNFGLSICHWFPCPHAILSFALGGNLVNFLLDGSPIKCLSKSGLILLISSVLKYHSTLRKACLMSMLMCDCVHDAPCMLMCDCVHAAPCMNNLALVILVICWRRSFQLLSERTRFFMSTSFGILSL